MYSLTMWDLVSNTNLRFGYILLEFIECLAVVRFTTRAQFDCGVACFGMELRERMECLLGRKQSHNHETGVFTLTDQMYYFNTSVHIGLNWDTGRGGIQINKKNESFEHGGYRQKAKQHKVTQQFQENPEMVDHN